MRAFVATGLAGFLLFVTGCGPSPESLAKEFADAQKSMNFQALMEVGQKISKLNPDELQRFQAALQKELPGMGQQLPGVNKEALEQMGRQIEEGFGKMADKMKDFGKGFEGFPKNIEFPK